MLFHQMDSLGAGINRLSMKDSLKEESFLKRVNVLVCWMLTLGNRLTGMYTPKFI